MDCFQRAQLDVLRAEISFASDRGSEAPLLLLKASRRLERLDVRRSRETYLDALTAAISAGRRARGTSADAVARAAIESRPSTKPPRASELLLDGLDNALARYQDAYTAAKEALEGPYGVSFSPLATVELVEAASRIGKEDSATPELERLAQGTSASGTYWAGAVEARCRALLSHGEAAERLYREAIERLTPTELGFDLARAHLLFGEWLRRERRPREAREQLRAAHRLFSDFGMGGFSERARVELRATGEHLCRRAVGTPTDLTPQEAQIALLVAQGTSNPEIAAQLFISKSTVEYHLRKVFRKLDVNSRIQLAKRVLESTSRPSQRI